MMNIFLHSPQDFQHICTIARNLEFFGHHQCYVFDTHNRIRERYGKSYSQKIRTISAGAFDKITFHTITNLIEFLQNYT